VKPPPSRAASCGKLMICTPASASRAAAIRLMFKASGPSTMTVRRIIVPGPPLNYYFVFAEPPLQSLLIAAAHEALSPGGYSGIPYFQDLLLPGGTFCSRVFAAASIAGQHLGSAPAT